MSDAFSLGGDPGSIRASATLWGKFATDASSASTDVTGVDTGEFSGDESETYRGRISEDLVPHLDVASEAWNLVSTALTTYAGKLETLQQRMGDLRSQYEEQKTTVSNAWNDLQSAKDADKQHTEGRQDAADKLTDGESLPADTYQAQTGSASTSYWDARGVMSDLESQAATVKSDHRTALTACCGDINNAKDKRPVEPPGWLDKLADFAGGVWDGIKAGVSWAAKNLGPVLKAISAVAGLLALIPCLTPIMGPIALVTGAVALTLDVMNKLMNGEGSWLQIGIDAVGLIPGVKSLSALGKMGKFANAARGTKMFKMANALNTMGKADKVWKGIDIGTSATNVGLNAYGVATGEKTWGDVAAAAVGFKGLGNPKFNSIKDIGASAVTTANEGYNLYTKVQNGTASYLDWIKFGTAAGSIGVNGRNTYAYRNGGGPSNRHPSNGQFRKAYDKPKYDWPHSKQTIAQSWNSAKGWGSQQLAAGALSMSLMMGPRR